MFRCKQFPVVTLRRVLELRPLRLLREDRVLFLLVLEARRPIRVSEVTLLALHFLRWHLLARPRHPRPLPLLVVLQTKYLQQRPKTSNRLGVAHIGVADVVLEGAFHQPLSSGNHLMRIILCLIVVEAWYVVWIEEEDVA